MTQITGSTPITYANTKSDGEVKREKDTKFAKSPVGALASGGLSIKKGSLLLQGTETDEQRKSTLKTGGIAGGIGAIVGGIGAALKNVSQQNAGISAHNLAGGNKDVVNAAVDTFVSTAKPSNKLSAKQISGIADVLNTGKFSKKFLAKETLKSAGKVGVIAAGAGIVAASVKHYLDNKKVEKQNSLAEAALDNSSDIKAAAKSHQG
ncbi:MAG: hypothetical protein LUE64_01275 [Candidatus Gastranaerophilales bacterium]|nr:hypothetical protein [Candidatus Gastranaerophilales bacterium]